MPRKGDIMATAKTPINNNQYTYLTNLAAGKTATGGTANTGQQTWAKSQLSKSVYTPPMPSTSSTNTTSAAPTMTPPASMQTSKSISSPVYTPAMPTSRTETTLNTLNDKVNATPFEFKGPTEFKYDVNSDPAYLSALATAQANIAQQQADTGAALRASGQGKSSYSEQVANQIGAKEMARLSSEIVPQLVEQAYNRYSDQANRDMQTQQLNYGASQDHLTNLGNLYGLQDKQDFQNPITEAQTTGKYTSGEAQQLYDTVLQAKQAYASATTPEARAAANAQAIAARQKLESLGYDTSKFGADVTLDNASNNRPYLSTLGQQSQDLANKESNLNAANTYMNQSGYILNPQEDWSGYPRQIASGGQGQTLTGQQTFSNLTTDQQNRDIANRTTALNEWAQAGYATPVVAKILGVPEGTPTNDAAYRTAAQTLDADMFEYQQMQDKAAAQNSPSQNQTINASTAGDLLSGALRKVVGRNDDGSAVYGTYTDPTKREQAFVDLYNNYGISGNDMVSALSKAGYTMTEINALKQHHPEVFQ